MAADPWTQGHVRASASDAIPPPDQRAPYEEIAFGASGLGWRHANPRELAVVFVHGWGGDARSTWTWRPPRWKKWDRRPHVSLIDLLAAAADLRCNYYAYAHPGGPISQVNIKTLADGLRTFITGNLQDERRLVLVGHSLGGLICRRAVLDMLEQAPAAELKVIGVLLLGTPNNGTELGRLPSWSRSGLEMVPMSAFLADLNRGWIARIANGGDPAQDIRNRTTLRCRTIVGDIDKVVSVASGGTLSLLGDYEVVARTGHRELSKPTDENHPAFVQVKRFILECQNEWPSRPLARAAALAGFRAASRIAAASEWLFKESETVTIAPQGGSPGPFAGWKDIFSCEIVCRRLGYPSRKRLHILVHTGSERPVSAVDYALSVGPGTLSEQDFAKFVDTMRGTAAGIGAYEGVVHSIRIRSGGVVADYKLVPEAVELHNTYVVLPYECDSELCDGRRDESVELTLRLRTWISRGQGWYRYTTANAVVDSLTVELDAPFALVGKDSFTAQQAIRVHGPAGTRDSAKITVTGPVEPGHWVDWTFKPEGD